MILIAGPCVIETEAHTLKMAEVLATLASKHRLDFYFKASFDKANRSSYDSYRGPGYEAGLCILGKVKEQIGCSVTSDIHETFQAEKAGEVLDLIQIPAMLCRQTDLIQAAASTGKPVNIKKGQFMSPWQMKGAYEKASVAGATQVMLTERGTSFGYGNLVVDMRSLYIMKKISSRLKIIFDATHSVQYPGWGGDREFVKPLAKAAAAVGIDGLFVEVHDNPEKALCDGANMIRPYDLEEILELIL